jgi:hypothetical protein
MKSSVTLELEGIPLRTSLRLLLRQLNLVYGVNDGLLIITSPESDLLSDGFGKQAAGRGLQ